MSYSRPTVRPLIVYIVMLLAYSIGYFAIPFTTRSCMLSIIKQKLPANYFETNVVSCFIIIENQINFSSSIF